MHVSYGTSVRLCSFSLLSKHSCTECTDHGCCVSLPKVADAYSLKAFGVSLKKNYAFEEGDAEFIQSTGELGADALENFVTANKMPLFIPFSQGNAELIFEAGIEQQLMFIGDDEALSGDAFEPFKKVLQRALIARFGQHALDQQHGGLSGCP